MKQRAFHAYCRAFTLIELLVVMALLVLLIAIGVPAFGSILNNNNRTRAQNDVRFAINAARDIALQQPAGQDAAAMFTFEPGGATRIVAYTQAGSTYDIPGSGFSHNGAPGGGLVRRDVFAPSPLAEPATLPLGWNVRALVTPGRLGRLDWYDRANRNYETNAANWVFPETGWYNSTQLTDGDDRQSFMVRFAGGTGQLRTSGGPALMVDPRPVSSARRRVTAPWQNIDQAEDLGVWTRSILSDPGLSDGLRRNLIGNVSGDTILAAPITDFGVYQEERLAGKLGVRLDRDTRSLYRQGNDPQLVDGMNAANITKLNRWMFGDTNLSESFGDEDDRPEASLYTITRSGGDVVEIPPIEGSD
ncbi:MAG: prepilin-type N-terminal cleavage/methylation domain-containing protein [Phycisphaerales bacterium]|jgi:prepilin-type N-terminal cleavage/methylation domain-containing protein|nr:prepilin-type N-terminal cleavage/methylation domain-containing protein [Phycisphaerales bacterium]